MLYSESNFFLTIQNRFRTVYVRKMEKNIDCTPLTPQVFRLFYAEIWDVLLHRRRVAIPESRPLSVGSPERNPCRLEQIITPHGRGKSNLRRTGRERGQQRGSIDDPSHKTCLFIKMNEGRERQLCYSDEFKPDVLVSLPCHRLYKSLSRGQPANLDFLQLFLAVMLFLVPSVSLSCFANKHRSVVQAHIWEFINRFLIKEASYAHQSYKKYSTNSQYYCNLK